MKKIFNWVYEDFNSHPVRFIIEIMIWVLFVFSALVMAFTVPNPPMLFIYPLFIIGCVLSIWAAHSRKSSGTVFTYIILLGIDIIGLIRLIY